MEKWNNKYRIPSARAPWWDYSNDGIYCITICTNNREHFFGECANGKMVLSTAGAIAQGFWYEIPKHFQFVQLGEFIVMPNHIHGILILDKIGMNTEMDNDINNGINEIPAQARFQNQGKNTISSIIGSYKSICSKHIHNAFPTLGFAWQPLFWDNINVSSILYFSK